MTLHLVGIPNPFANGWTVGHPDQSKTFKYCLYTPDKWDQKETFFAGVVVDSIPITAGGPNAAPSRLYTIRTVVHSLVIRRRDDQIWAIPKNGFDKIGHYEVTRFWPVYWWKYNWLRRRAVWLARVTGRNIDNLILEDRLQRAAGDAAHRAIRRWANKPGDDVVIDDNDNAVVMRAAATIREWEHRDCDDLFGFGGIPPCGLLRGPGGPAAYGEMPPDLQ